MPLPLNVLRKYPNKVFVETGTLTGQGVRRALKAGFKRIHTVDIDAKCIRRVRALHRHNPRVHVVLGDSLTMLRAVLPKIKKPITFWLDAHPPGKLSLMSDRCPLVKELTVIQKHACPAPHVILMDDMRIFMPGDPQLLEYMLMTSWPGCKISREDSVCAANDIMVCQLP